MRILPTRSIPAFSYEINLDGRPFRLAFRWNTIAEFWTIDIKTRTGIDLIRGIKMMINYDILRIYKRHDLPPGGLIPIDTTRRLKRIGFEDLEENIRLVYVPRDELDAII